MLLPAFRVGANAVFGVYNMIRRYVNLVDATILVLSFSLVSAILVALRLLLPSENSIAQVFQMPLGVIVMEFLLALGGGLGLRALRRVLYEMDHRYQPLPIERRQRILIFGAGLSGLGIALEIARYPHLQLVGFIDDDLAKQGCLIAGYSVLAASEKLPAIIREQQVSDIIICAGSMSSQVLRRIQQDCCLQGVKPISFQPQRRFRVGIPQEALVRPPEQLGERNLVSKSRILAEPKDYARRSLGLSPRSRLEEGAHTP